MSNLSLSVQKIRLEPGGVAHVARRSEFFTCLEATDKFKISFDGSPAADFYAGLTYEPDSAFQELRIENHGAAEILVEFALGAGNIRDARVSLAEAGNVPTKEETPDTFTTGAPTVAADSACTLLAGVNTARREIALSAPLSGGTVYIAGNAAAGAAEGLPLHPGQTLFLTTTAAIYARNDTGGPVTIAAAELEFGF